MTTAENGAVALELMSKQTENNDECAHPFDVVLMDLQMPIMDGLEATSRLRKLESTINAAAKSGGGGGKYASSEMHLMIIGCSANSDNDTMKAAFAAGIDDFIPKPFKIQVFHDIYSKLMAGKEEGAAGGSLKTERTTK